MATDGRRAVVVAAATGAKTGLDGRHRGERQRGKGIMNIFDLQQ